MPAFRRDARLCLFLLPHVAADALAHGGEAARADLGAEVEVVLSGVIEGGAGLGGGELPELIARVPVVQGLELRAPEQPLQ